jgi:hypothetical protein
MQPDPDFRGAAADVLRLEARGLTRTEALGEIGRRLRLDDLAELRRAADRLRIVRAVERHTRRAAT